MFDYICKLGFWSLLYFKFASGSMFALISIGKKRKESWPILQLITRGRATFFFCLTFGHLLSHPSSLVIACILLKFPNWFSFSPSSDWLSVRRSVAWWKAQGSIWIFSSLSSWVPSVRFLACRGSQRLPCAQSLMWMPSLSWAKPRPPARSPRSRRWKSRGWLGSSWLFLLVRGKWMVGLICGGVEFSFSSLVNPTAW